MHFSLFGFFRPIALAFTGLTALAVALGRTAPEGPDSRTSAAVRYRAVNWYLYNKADPAPHFIDAETGRIVSLPLNGAGYCKYLSCSPWRDAHGQAQVVGLAGGPSAEDAAQRGSAIVLSRHTFPEGRVLDTVPLDWIVPTSVPCWFPGKTLRVVFSAANGRLYRLSFPGERGTPESERDDLLTPVPLSWDRNLLGGGTVWVSDPVWPSDPRLGDRLIVSVTVSGNVGADGEAIGGQLWWLQLSPDRRAVRAAGRLTDTAGEISERWPAVTTDARGDIKLAYLAGRHGEKGWRLRLARIDIDAATGAPHAGPPCSVPQTGEGIPVPPIFSADGRWVHIMSRCGRAPAAVERFDVRACTGDAPPSPPDAG